MSGRHNAESATHYRTATIDGVGVSYREAGPSDAPVVVLLHGFPSSWRRPHSGPCRPSWVPADRDQRRGARPSTAVKAIVCVHQAGSAQWARKASIERSSR
jgi:pimeloyl-ACP methyl ester carboxylesterase